MRRIACSILHFHPTAVFVLQRMVPSADTAGERHGAFVELVLDSPITARREKLKLSANSRTAEHDGLRRGTDKVGCVHVTAETSYRIPGRQHYAMPDETKGSGGYHNARSYVRRKR